MTSARVAALLDQMAGQRILVLGDVMLDEYLWGSAERISPEAPVLVVRRERMTRVPGGAANVVHCLNALGARAGIVSVCGADEAGADLAAQLERGGAEPVVMLHATDRPTTLKTRVVAHSQQVVRIDHEVREPLEAALTARLVTEAEAALAGCAGLLISDYDKGVLTPQSIPRLLEAARRQGVPVAVNAKPRYARHYRGVALLTVNRAEAEAVSGIAPLTLANAAEVAAELGCQLEVERLLVTLGGDGAMLWSAAGGSERVPPVPVEVYDAAGAGDATIAACHLALCAGVAPREAVELAMRAAAVVVRKVGVQTATPAEIRALG